MPETMLGAIGNRSLQTLTERQGELRQSYIRFEIATEPLAEDADITRATVAILEFHLAILAFSEAVHEMGVATVGEAIPRIEAIATRASSIAGIDVGQTLGEHADLLPESVRNRVPHASEPAAAPMPALLRAAASLVAACPIDALEVHAISAGLPELGHRCRTAFEALEAFLRRNDPAQEESTRTAGRAYADGRLSAREVASVLKVDPSDAVALLEAHGFCRRPETIRLSDDERAQALERLRAERVQREGRPVPTRERLLRDVAASQRIEGVDVRPWLRTDRR